MPAGLVFFGLMTVLHPLAALDSAPSERRIAAAIVFSVFWGFWFCLSIYFLAACWCYSLRISNERITSSGVFTTREILLANVAEVRWKLSGRGGSVVLSDSCVTVKIEMDVFAQAERVWIMRFIHAQIAAPLHKNWELFCHKVALPLVDRIERDQGVASQLKEGEVLIKRRRWDWYLLPVAALAAVWGVASATWLGKPRLLFIPVLPLFFWGMLRFSTPKSGFVSKSMTATPGHSWVLLLLLIELIIVVGGVFGFPVIRPMLPIPNVITGALIVGIVCGTFAQAFLIDKKRHARDIAASAASVEEWNRRRQMRCGAYKLTSTPQFSSFRSNTTR